MSKVPECGYQLLAHVLQTLEQLGIDGCDPGDVALRGGEALQLSSSVRPAFHMNYTSAFQSWPASVTDLGNRSKTCPQD